MLWVHGRFKVCDGVYMATSASQPKNILNFMKPENDFLSCTIPIILNKSFY